MVKRLVVGAHYGFRDWLAQRVTAVVMAVYTVYMLVRIALLPAHDNEAWRTLMAGGFTKFVTFLFALALFYHAWVGIRDIWMDYVQQISLRLTLHVLTLLALVGYAGWVAQILWRL
ncbi:MAG: succinate dehydrogenase, hydrophobic membrane anchor protein [Candidatus Dactylopiibacterium carminicum]|uniref:Succinate dehydrogenase hydrophobic membrane anchor subunit n=1 Tax=Candidatus Dactylopiibacterium carminicum TaxID=857335 RepID=A0A272EUN4_9RHOO|nr:succinate dehydrogenase, hydrophobic membrane anchor protein [Candidatus Dactylopiibacterium carminicum]PAS93805.1 MAG: succinate dehydrogenase, hydrophobic membrane anchor protein [Candidatus Dactylopiibacterium carminicum]PAS96842.1 MAG: succinate dehydrogenase, hydrophobic membrane anchor protein [Candidatus Dactylopiibacterium carminicum]PAT00366.1 MAG: succinate dehydrogenase, hydrophobic membrane anchor protein [Candidatus Dactylopiibacterium carminicum]